MSIHRKQLLKRPKRKNKKKSCVASKKYIDSLYTNRAEIAYQ